MDFFMVLSIVCGSKLSEGEVFEFELSWFCDFDRSSRTLSPTRYFKTIIYPFVHFKVLKETLKSNFSALQL